MDLNGCLTRNIGTELGDICIKSLRKLLNTVQAEERIDMLDELAPYPVTSSLHCKVRTL